MHPLRSILFIALILRLLAAFFSQGYAFNDDHFDVITVAQNWLYGLPHWLQPDDPPRHSIFYTGIHYLIFYLLEAVGIESPSNKMLIIRLIHALYSLLVVYYGYKITKLLSTPSDARLVGLILSVIWFMPFMSVRNLVEMVCIPPFLAAFYLMLKADKESHIAWKLWMAAGILFGLAFVIRYHSILFMGGAGLILLFRKQWMKIIWLSIGFIITAFLIQGTIDMIIFRYPFHSLVAYYEFNAQNENLLIVGPAYRFVLTVLGFLVPPVSLFLVYGFIKSRKIEMLMLSAALTFFAFHSIFPHKQERFILPLFPIIIILGVIGWRRHIAHSSFWIQHKKLLRYSWTFFWVLNITAALALAFTYSKKSRIAPLIFLSGKSDLKGIVIETSDNDVSNPPLFYLGALAIEYEDFTLDNNNTWSEFKTNQKTLPEEFIRVYTKGTGKTIAELEEEIAIFAQEPNYFIFTGKENLKQRVKNLKGIYPGLVFEKAIEASLYDRLLHFLNPRVHQDEYINIYKSSN